jgi:hypothetical protein
MCAPWGSDHGASLVRLAHGCLAVRSVSALLKLSQLQPLVSITGDERTDGGVSQFERHEAAPRNNAIRHL